MKLLIISDTHGHITKAETLIERYLPHGLTHVIHCGDCIDDAKRLEVMYPEVTVLKVPGNCDYGCYGSDSTLVTEVEDLPIMITHGHKHHAKSDYDELWIDAEAYEVGLVVFGHTHIAYIEWRDGVLLLNPGSLSLPKDGVYGRYAVLEVVAGQIRDVAMMQMRSEKELVRIN